MTTEKRFAPSGLAVDQLGNVGDMASRGVIGVSKQASPTSRPVGLAALGGLLVVLCVLLAGCGTGQRERESMAAAREFLAAIDAGDTGAACAMIAPRTREDLEFSEKSSCEEALGGLELSGEAVHAAAVWSDRAQVHGDNDTLFLAQFADGWKISAAGCTPQGERPYECLLGGA
jgi:hypothetical protein